MGELILTVFWLVIGTLGAVVGLAFYGLPTIIAIARKRSDIALIAVVNLVGFWFFFIGWVVALIMALLPENRRSGDVTVIQQTTTPAAPMPIPAPVVSVPSVPSVPPGLPGLPGPSGPPGSPGPFESMSAWRSHPAAQQPTPRHDPPPRPVQQPLPPSDSAPAGSSPAESSPAESARPDSLGEELPPVAPPGTPPDSPPDPPHRPGDPA